MAKQSKYVYDLILVRFIAYPLLYSQINENKLAYTRHEPYGVVVSVCPSRRQS